MTEVKPAAKAWSWQVNLVAFGLVTLAALLYALGQVYYLRLTLTNHLRDSRQMILRAVDRQTELGALAEEAVNDTVRLFLSNTARFLDFLNDVEPFHQAELASFADENGLAGVAMVDGSGHVASGPERWLPAAPECAAPSALLSQVDGIFVLSWPRPQGGCVLVGYPASRLEELRDQFSLDALLAFLSSSPEIAFLERLQPGKDYGVMGDDIARQTLDIQGQQVIIGFETATYQQQVVRIWQNFLLYASLFIGFGLLLSFILYRLQNHHVQEITRYERELAREQEDAALGRAAATIAHEVRNPLNAMGLGLQRIELEAELSSEHVELLTAMKTSLKRTNAIVEGLHRFSRPLVPQYAEVEVDKIIAEQLLLRQSQCEQQGITVDFRPGAAGIVQADADLLAQLFDNIIKNAVEAQPQGGWLRLSTVCKDEGVLISLENGGFDRREDIARLAEPYFTGKTRGSGLGLAICSKIVEAHRGSLQFAEVNSGVLQVKVWLPRQPLHLED